MGAVGGCLGGVNCPEGGGGEASVDGPGGRVRESKGVRGSSGGVRSGVGRGQLLKARAFRGADEGDFITKPDLTLAGRGCTLRRRRPYVGGNSCSRCRSPLQGGDMSSQFIQRRGQGAAGGGDKAARGRGVGLSVAGSGGWGSVNGCARGRLQDGGSGSGGRVRRGGRGRCGRPWRGWGCWRGGLVGLRGIGGAIGVLGALGGVEVGRGARDRP